LQQEATKRHPSGADMIDRDADGDAGEGADNGECREQPGGRGEIEGEVSLNGSERRRRLADLEGRNDARTHDQQDGRPARALRGQITHDQAPAS
jgi:hypothetical protein